MGTKMNPSPNDCYVKAAPDEPYFTLLGRDPAAPFVILFWCKMRELMSGPADNEGKIQEAVACAASMRDWAAILGKDEKLKLAYDAFNAACAIIADATKRATIEPGV